MEVGSTFPTDPAELLAGQRPGLGVKLALYENPVQAVTQDFDKLNLAGEGS